MLRGVKSWSELELENLSDDYDHVDIQNTYGKVFRLPRSKVLWPKRKFQCWRGDLVVMNEDNSDSIKSFKLIPKNTIAFFRVIGTYYRVSGQLSDCGEPIVMCAVHFIKLEFMFSAMGLVKNMSVEDAAIPYEVFDEEIRKVDLLELLVRYQRLGEYIREFAKDVE